MPPLAEAALTQRLIGTFFDVYNYFGYGFAESVYARAMELELVSRGFLIAKEAPLEVSYKGTLVGVYRADIIVESRVILELKAGERLSAGDPEQLHNYLRAASLQVGLLLHFGPRPSFKRIIAESPRDRREKAASSEEPIRSSVHPSHP